MVATNEKPERIGYSQQEAAAVLGVSTETIRRWEKAGRLHGTFPSGAKGGKRIYPAADVRRLAGEAAGIGG